MDLLEFLKKYSKVDPEFIDDFFGMYAPKDKYNFCINIDAITKWFNMRKDNIKNTLVSSYVEKVDYIVKTTKRKRGGKPLEIILVTPKCFKLMAMQGRTKRAAEVRAFYYELENVLDRYKEYIIDGLNQKIQQLEHNQKPKINPKKGIIYIIQASDDNTLYKVGRTVNLKKRLNAYNGDKKDDIQPLFIYETDNVQAVEQCVKAYAKQFQYRKYKEVYQTSLDMLKVLIAECAEFNELVTLKLRNKANRQKGGGNINYFIAIYPK